MTNSPRPPFWQDNSATLAPQIAAIARGFRCHLVALPASIWYSCRISTQANPRRSAVERQQRMSPWDHGPAEPSADESPILAARNAKIGMVLFVIYLVLYAGFVLLCAFAPERMAERPAAGVNLAIWYGFGLLGAALGLALVYSWLCRLRGKS